MTNFHLMYCPRCGRREEHNLPVRCPCGAMMEIPAVMEPVPTHENLLQIARAAARYHDYLSKNTGVGPEWPVEILVAEDAREEMIRLLNDAGNAIKPFKEFLLRK